MCTEKFNQLRHPVLADGFSRAPPFLFALARFLRFPLEMCVRVVQKAHALNIAGHRRVLHHAEASHAGRF
jgi:hypothetical protein